MISKGVSPEEPSRAVPKAKSRHNGQLKKRALVVDPTHEISEQLSQVLPLEWTVQEAADNATALDLAKSTGFDLIITSQDSSAKEDIELLRSIRRLRGHTRMIILTDESTPKDVLEAMRQGAFSYFSQPFTLAQLAEAVESAVEEPCWDDGIEILATGPDWVRLMARCDRTTAERVLQFVREMIELPEEEKEVVGWALRELLMNAMEYGGKFNPEHYVELSYLRTKRAVACRVKDPGEGFSFDELRHAAISNPPGDPLRHLNYREAEKLRPGGFGVLLARNLVDELIYSDKGNEVLLIKYVDSPGSRKQ